jgi:hypothetical protein
MVGQEDRTACGVSPSFVGQLRSQLTVNVDSDSEQRRYVSKHGTAAVMNIVALRRPKPASSVTLTAPTPGPVDCTPITFTAPKQHAPGEVLSVGAFVQDYHREGRRRPACRCLVPQRSRDRRRAGRAVEGGGGEGEGADPIVSALPAPQPVRARRGRMKKLLPTVLTVLTIALPVPSPVEAYMHHARRSWVRGVFHHHPYRHHAYVHRRYVHGLFTHHHRSVDRCHSRGPPAVLS